MSRGRPSKWDEGGLFRTERDLKEDWDSYLPSHPAGTTERKWDRRMTAEVSNRISSLLKVAGQRTALSSGLRNITDLVATGKHNKGRAIIDYNDWMDQHGSGNFTNADIFITLETTAGDIVDTLDGALRGPDACLEQANRACDALKEKCRALIYQRHLKQLPADHHLPEVRLPVDHRAVHHASTHLHLDSSSPCGSSSSGSNPLGDAPSSLSLSVCLSLCLPSLSSLTFEP